jgi:hypothetical protein
MRGGRWRVRPVPLSDALAVLLPEPQEIHLLRAVLGLGKDAIPEALRQRLRAAALWERRRLHRIGEILLEVLESLAAAGVQPLLTGGLAVALTAYAQPHLRHCHDIDLLVSPDERSTAVAALTNAGFWRGEAAFLHQNGLPVRLHETLLTAPFYRLPETSMRWRACTVAFAGHEVRVLRPCDNLLHLLARVAVGNVRSAPQWAADAMVLQRHAPLTIVEWRDLSCAAISGGLALPFAVLLPFLHLLGASIPDEIMQQIAGAAAKSKPGARGTALFHALESRQASLSQMLARCSWRTRWRILCWLLIPAPAGLTAWRNRRLRRWNPLKCVQRLESSGKLTL